LPHTFPHASQALLSTAFNLYFEGGVLKQLLSLRTDENDTDCVAVSPSKSTLQCSTASSYKITLSHTFLENFTAESVIQVAESWFLGDSSRSTQPSWSNVALWCCTLKTFGLPSYYSQLLVKPFLIQVPRI
jgi:hypothetical protein